LLNSLESTTAGDSLDRQYPSFIVSFQGPGRIFPRHPSSMHNKDLVFAANAESVEITKFLAFAQNVIATVNDVAATGNSIETWRIDSHIR
jgi:polysaccharide biosynthesis/export protein